MSLHNNFRARRINVNTYWKNSTDLCERASDYEELSTGNAHFTCSEVFFTYTAFNVSQRAGTKQTLISVWHWKKCNQSVAHERKSRWIEKRLENFSASRFDFSWSSQRKKEWDRNVLSGSLSIRLGMFTFFPFIRSRKARETHKAMARCIITMGRFCVYSIIIATALKFQRDFLLPDVRRCTLSSSMILACDRTRLNACGFT